MNETAAGSLQGTMGSDLPDQAADAAPSDCGGATFERIVADHQERITRLVHRLLDGGDGVEDVVQDVFVAALGHLGQFRGESAVSTWLARIAVNRCRSHRRRGRLACRWLPWLARPAASDDHQGQARAIHEEIRRAVGRLPEKYRELIVLHYYEEIPLAEIAARMKEIEARLETIDGLIHDIQNGPVPKLLADQELIENELRRVTATLAEERQTVDHLKQELNSLQKPTVKIIRP